MVDTNAYRANGFAFFRDVFSEQELDSIAQSVKAVDPHGSGSMRSSETYAIRQVMRHAPELRDKIWNVPMRMAVEEVIGKNAFVVKSIWFDKPPGGNWFVAYHQDISINVEERVEVPGYGRWTSKHGLIGVVPTAEVLENVLTLRIHLDRADATNGALRVKPGSHRDGILNSSKSPVPEVVCEMEAGDVMLMSPLLLHASMRSTTDAPRRVLHLEVTNRHLDGGLKWSECWPV